MTRAATTQQAADALLLAVRPRQGCWSENDYLWLTDHCTRLVEFTDGRIEELPLPTDTHQTVLASLFRLFDRHVDALGGVVRFAALRLRVGEGRFREPDLLVLLDANDPRRQDRYWLGADLAIEVVSPTIRPGTTRRKGPTTPRLASPSTGSWILDAARSPFSRFVVTSIRSTACSRAATLPRRPCSTGSRWTWRPRWTSGLGAASSWGRPQLGRFRRAVPGCPRRIRALELEMSAPAPDTIQSAREELILRRDTHQISSPTSCVRNVCAAWSSRCGAAPNRRLDWPGRPSNTFGTSGSSRRATLSPSPIRSTAK